MVEAHTPRAEARAHHNIGRVLLTNSDRTALAGSNPQPFACLPGPAIEVVELLPRELHHWNHVAASPIALHRLAGPQPGGHAGERDGRGSLEHPEPARSFTPRRRLDVEPEHA